MTNGARDTRDDEAPLSEEMADQLASKFRPSWEEAEDSFAQSAHHGPSDTIIDGMPTLEVRNSVPTHHDLLGDDDSSLQLPKRSARAGLPDFSTLDSIASPEEITSPSIEAYRPDLGEPVSLPQNKHSRAVAFGGLAIAGLILVAALVAQLSGRDTPSTAPTTAQENETTRPGPARTDDVVAKAPATATTAPTVEARAAAPEVPATPTQTPRTAEKPERAPPPEKPAPKEAAKPRPEKPAAPTPKKPPERPAPAPKTEPKNGQQGGIIRETPF